MTSLYNQREFPKPLLKPKVERPDKDHKKDIIEKDTNIKSTHSRALRVGQRE